MTKLIEILYNLLLRLFKKEENEVLNEEIVEETVIEEPAEETIEEEIINNIEIEETMEEKILKLRVERTFTCTGYTIGHLYIDGEYFCDTIEDYDRGLDSKMSLEKIKSIKVKDETAIPTGVYSVDMNTQSPKYSDFEKYKWAKEFGGKLPRLIDVPGYAGVLIHVGNTAAHTSGCLLVGKNTEKGKITSSTVWFQTLMKKYLLPAHKEGKKIQIEYVRNYK